MIYFLSFSYNKIKESAYETIQSHFARSAGEEPNSPMPPTYFKLGQLYEINEDKRDTHYSWKLNACCKYRSWCCCEQKGC